MRAFALLLLAATVQAQDFEKEVLPVLRRRCFSCHSGQARRPKAGLRLDSKAFLLVGSKRGPVLVPGDAGRSMLYTRAALPEDHEDVMPPEGDPLGKTHLELIRSWIAGGAKFGTWTGTKPPAKPTAPVRKGPGAFAVYERLAKDLAAAPEAAVKAAREAGARVSTVYGKLLRVEFIEESDKVTDKQIGALTPLRAHIAILSLRQTRITDRAVATITKMTRLVRLDLPKTGITDAGLTALTKAKPPELRILNLYGTAVTDTGVASLGALSKLTALYLWETKATEIGVKALSMVLPQCRIHFKRTLPAARERGNDDGNRRRR